MTYGTRQVPRERWEARNLGRIEGLEPDGCGLQGNEGRIEAPSRACHSEVEGRRRREQPRAWDEGMFLAVGMKRGMRSDRPGRTHA
jgi:hypothetical protein